MSINKAILLTSLGWGGFSLSFKGSTVILLLLVLLAFFWTLFSYRWTTPPTSFSLRLVLGLLRSVALLLVIFLIFEPSLSRHQEKRLKPLLAVLIDDSESMRMQDASSDRSQQLKALLNDASWGDLRGKADLEYFALSDSLRKLNGLFYDSLHFKTIGTDLSDGWRAALKQENGPDYAGILLISDGGDNVGRDPVQTATETSVPIFTIGIGDTTQVQDAGIAALTGDSIVYRGKKTTLNVRIKARGLEGAPARLELTGADGQVLAAASIKLPPHDLEAETTLEFIPERVGVLPLNLRLSATEGEVSAENNLRSYALEVKESRIRVLFISGAPCYEAMFFLRAAAHLPDLEVTALTIKNDGTFYGNGSADLNKLVNDADLLVLLDFSGVSRSEAAQVRLRQALEMKPLPRWMWLKGDQPVENLKTWAGGLPFTSSPARVSLEARAVPDRFYTVLDPDAQTVDAPQWEQMPPVYTPARHIQPQGGCSILVSFKDVQTGQNLGPAVICWESGNKRYAVTFGSGYWHWSFLIQGLSGSDEFYTGFISRILRWLAASPQTRTLRLATYKKLYSSGESVDLNARVLGGDGRYLTTPQVIVVIEGSEGQSKLLLEADQYGLYRGNFPPEAVGNYALRGWAIADRDTLGIDSGSFLVEGYNIEKETLNQNRPLLEAIAKNSGGAYFSADSLSQFVQSFQAPPRIKAVGWQRRFFLNWDIWTVLILVLGLEWLIRKRRGML